MISDSLRFRIGCWLVPELRLARGYDEQQEVYERAKPLGVIAIACVLAIWILLFVPSIVWAWQHGSFDWTDAPMVFNIALFAAMIPYQWRYSRRIARQYLQLRAVPICTRCACDLTGIDTHASSHCPRCGDSIDPDSPEGVAQLAMKATSIRYRFLRIFLPELALARTDFERGLIAYESKLGNVLWFEFMLLFVAAFMSARWLPTGSWHPFPASEQDSLLLALLPLIPVAAAVIVGPIYINMARGAARFKLHARGVNLCLHCGHTE